MSIATDTIANLIDSARARQDSEDSVVIDGEDARLIRAAMANTPFAPDSPGRWSIGLDRGTLTAAQVAEWMARHVECLREYTATIEDQASRLRELERQRAAVRSFLGTDGGQA
ncbi:MAG: hypothetical protein RR101_15430 [Burkholderiaceae bacterium]